MKQWQRNKPDLFTKNARNHQGHDKLAVISTVSRSFSDEKIEVVLGCDSQSLT